MPISGDELGLPAISKKQAQLVAIATHAQVEEALHVYARDHGANNVMRCDPLDDMFAERSLSTAISAQRSVTTMCLLQRGLVCEIPARNPTPLARKRLHYQAQALPFRAALFDGHRLTATLRISLALKIDEMPCHAWVGCAI